MCRLEWGCAGEPARPIQSTPSARRRDARTMKDVARRIRRKIDWTAESYENDADFLAAYYAALRGRLEHRLLFGHRRKDKFDVA